MAARDAAFARTMSQRSAGAGGFPGQGDVGGMSMTMATQSRGVALEMEVDEGCMGVTGISPLEASKFETLFKLLCDELTQTIGEEDLADLMPRLGVFASEDELHELFCQVDKDSSGGIDFTEFLQLMARHRESTQLALLEGERASYAELRQAGELAHVLRPDEPVGMCADVMTLLLILFWYVIVLYEDVRQAAIPAQEAFKTVAGVLLMVDIARLSLTAGGGGESNPVDDRQAVRQEYIQSRRFILDLIAALPVDLVLMYSEQQLAMRITQHLRLAKIFVLPHLFASTPRSILSANLAKFYFFAVPLIRICFWAVITVHGFSMLWILISDSGEYLYEDAVYFVVYTLTTTGFGDIKVTSDSQKAFAIFLFCAATVVTGLVVGKLVQFSQQADLQTDAHKRMMETLAALNHLSIPNDFKAEVLAFQLHRLKHSNSLFNDTISGLPRCMQDRMALYARMKIVRLVPIFAEVAEIGVAKLAQSLVNLYVSPEEYIVIAGEEGEEMFILFHGMCCVTLPNGKWIATIKRGGVFGELALVETTRRAASIKSLTYCQLFRLDKTSFESIIQNFPELIDSIKAVSTALQSRLEKSTSDRQDTRSDNASTRTSEPDDPFVDSPPHSLGGGSRHSSDGHEMDGIDVVSVTDAERGGAHGQPPDAGELGRLDASGVSGFTATGGARTEGTLAASTNTANTNAYANNADPDTLSNSFVSPSNTAGRRKLSAWSRDSGLSLDPRPPDVPRRGHKRNRFEHLKRRDDRDDAKSEVGLFTVSSPSMPVFNAIPLGTRPSDLLGDSAYDDSSSSPRSMKELLMSMTQEDPVSQLPISGSALGQPTEKTVSFRPCQSQSPADKLISPISRESVDRTDRRASACSSRAGSERVAPRKVVKFAPATAERANGLVKKASRKFKSLLAGREGVKQKMVVVPQATLMQIGSLIDDLTAGINELRAEQAQVADRARTAQGGAADAAGAG